MSIERFTEELIEIKTPSIKRLVLKCLEAAPSYFWECTSSNTGKYHPKDEFVEGGLVLHSKRVTKVANYLCQCLEIKGIERDCVLAACIMHDLCKNGFPNNTGNTVDGHGYLWSELARTVFTKNEMRDNINYGTISRLILLHMGSYDMPYILDWSDELATIVHISDVIASREDIIVGITDNENL